MNILTLLLPVFLGLLGGYIVNYISDVLPMTRRFSQPTCPNCGNENVDSWEVDRNENGELTPQECGKCGIEFNVERDVEVTYNTWFDDEEQK